jgi:hypothetical protein
LGLSPIPRSIDKLYRESIESALEFWGMYQQIKCKEYFNYCIVKQWTFEENFKRFFIITFNYISVISWWSVLLVEETGENHPLAACH